MLDSPQTTEMLVGLGLRVGTFFLCLGFFPNNLVPFTARLACGIGALFLLMPSSSSVATLFLETGEALHANSEGQGLAIASGVLPRYDVLLIEMLFGALLAVCASLVAYVAELLSSWIESLFFSKDVFRELTPQSFQQVSIFRTFFFLILLYILFSQGYGAELLRFLADSVSLVPYQRVEAGDAFVVSSVLFSRLVIETGKLAFFIAILLVAPFVVASLVVDSLWLLARKYFKSCFDVSLAMSSRALVLTMLLSTSLYMFSAQIGSVVQRSLESIRVQQIVTQTQTPRGRDVR